MTTKKSKPKAVTPDYTMNEQEQDVVNKALARYKGDRTPRLKVTENRVSNNHPNEAIGELLLMAAIGTEDRDFFRGMLFYLANAASLQGQPPDEIELNSMFSVLKDIKPRDHLEAMLAAQIAAVHVSAMRFANSLGNAANAHELEMAERIFSKL